MRILIDLQGAQTESRFRGIGRYSTSLVTAMVRQCKEHELWICLNATLADSISEVRKQFDGLLPQSRIKVFDSLQSVGWPDEGNRWRRGAAELARESFVASLQPDIVHLSSLFEGSQCTAVTSVGKLANGPHSAVTLYDLIPLLNQEKYLSSDWTRQWYMDKVKSLLRSDLLLAISDYARQEAVTALGIDKSRIVNISSAVSDHFAPKAVGPAERDYLHRRFGIAGAYFMYSGAMEPRKNADRLFEAFAQLPPGIRNSYQLVLAGNVAGHHLEQLDKLATDLGIKDKLVLTGYVTEDELVLLYNAAKLYVFPSLHEGFGLPALEAMSCGTATIGSSTTSVPEVIGRADALFDPTNSLAIASAIERVVSDDDFNASLRLHALEQSAKFSWDASARKAIEAFESVAPDKTQSRLWAVSAPRLKTAYEDLIVAVAALPQNEVSISEQDLIDAANMISTNQQRVEHAARTGPVPERVSWRIEGPFDSSYSLALVNRELARAISALGHDVALHSTEGPGDFLPDESFLRANPDLRSLNERSDSLPSSEADVTSRLLYPPRVSGMSSRVNMLHSYAWEESGFPQEWVRDFNESLQGISCLSAHVEKVLIDNGVSVPLSIASCGVDHWDRVTADGTYAIPGKKFRFLHVSSCFPRKGADVLIRAFAEAFKSSDEASLVIKTFSNPHNNINQWLAEARQGRQDFPEIIVIEQDLSEPQLKALYEGCDALVAPSRAEGFGLPIAEAMISGLPVITTGWGGQLDFCTPSTVWLVDYAFAPAQTHFSIFGSVWAEPDAKSLADAMREVHDLSAEQKNTRVEAAKALLRSKFKWSDVATRQVESVGRFAQAPLPTLPSIGWVSTWNTKCGIAAYSSNLINHLDNRLTVFAPRTEESILADEENVRRCWNGGGADDLLQLARSIDEIAPDVVVIQFQYSFFDFSALGDLISRQLQAGRAVCLMLHATVDPPLEHRKQLASLADVFKNCDRVLVHTHHDMNNLKNIGVVDNVALFPHGVMEGPPSLKRPVQGRLTVASYGFLLPHKGLVELIDAVALLAGRGIDVRLKMINAEYPVAESRALAELIRARIVERGLTEAITLCTDFLSDEQSLRVLADSDLVIFPYQETGESSSAAVRHGLASGRQVAVTPLAIFDDLGQAVIRLPGTSAESLAAGIEAYSVQRHEESAELDGISETAEKWREAHKVANLSSRLNNMLGQLVNKRKYPQTQDMARAVVLD